MEETHGKRRRKKEKYCSILLILQEIFFTSELFKVIQDAVLLILHHRTVSGSRTFSSDGILSAYESYGQRTQRSGDNRLESTASCTVHADSVEGTSEHRFFWVDIKLAHKNGFRSFSTSRRLPTNVSKP